MRWVDHKSFFGLDRRQRRAALRLNERRREASDGEPPSLAAALRQLRVRAMAAYTTDGVAEFIERARAVAELAQAFGEIAIGRALMRIVAEVASRPQEDWRDWLDERMGELADDGRAPNA